MKIKSLENAGNNVGTIAHGQGHVQITTIGAGTDPVARAEPLCIQATLRGLDTGLDADQGRATPGRGSQVADSATAGDRPGAIAPAARPVLADLAHAGRRQRRIDRPEPASRQPREQHPPAATIETGLRYPLDAGQPAPGLGAAIEQAQPGALVRIAFNHQQLVLGCTVQGLQRLLRRHRQRLQALITR